MPDFRDLCDLNLVWWQWTEPLCLRSLERNVWLLCQSKPKHIQRGQRTGRSKNPKRLRERQRPFDRHPPHLQQSGGSQENCTNHTPRRMARSTMVGRVSATVPFMPLAFLLQKSCTFFFQHLVESTVVTLTHIFFLVSRTCDRSSNTRAFGSRHVDCFVPRATRKSFVHLMLSGTLLESQFSSPKPFSSFLSTPFPTSTPNPMGTSLLRRFRSGKKVGCDCYVGPFSKKGLPGPNDTSVTQNAI